MAIDPRIPLGVQPIDIASPMQTLAQVFAIRNQQQQREETAQRIELQRQALEDNRTKAAQQEAVRQRTLAEDKAFQLAFSGDTLPTPEQLFRINPERGEKIATALNTLQNARLKGITDKWGAAAQMAGGVQALPEALRPQAYGVARDTLIGSGAFTEDEIPEQYSPDILTAVQMRGLTPEKQVDLMTPKPVQVAPGGTLVDPRTGKVTYTAPPKPPDPGSFEDYLVTYMRDVAKRPFDERTAADVEAARERYRLDQRPSIVNVGGGDVDIDAIADAIVQGIQPPDVKGLYRYGAPLRSALAKRGYDLTTAQTDWAAAQRHFSSLNGPQQTRFRQAIDTAVHSLDVIDDLSKQWQAGGFPILNRARLKAAKGGALGTEAAKIATALDAQITDLTSELGQVYMGGYSPTDHALQLASKNLSSDWSADVLKNMTALARKNLTIRANSVANVGAIGASPVNPYVPAPAAPPAPTTPAPASPVFGLTYQQYLDAQKGKR